MDSKISLSRRQMVLAGLSLAVAGCSQPLVLDTTRRPGPAWPETGDWRQPRPQRPYAVLAAGQKPEPVTPDKPASTPGVQAISRAHWTRTGTNRANVNAMGHIDRITIHHEGWKPVYFTDQKATAARIEQIRSVHVRDRGWADIGYHYVIDRAGRIWEARPIQYQGAHVKRNNEHNVGILVLGNFDQQRPSTAQIERLVLTVKQLQSQYRLPAGRVYTHQEIALKAYPTACPGRSLQRSVAGLRKTKHLA